MVAIFKSSLQNLSPLPTNLKVESLAKPKTGVAQDNDPPIFVTRG